MSAAMNSSSLCFIMFFAFIVLFIYVQAFPFEHVNDATNPDNTVLLIPRHTKRSIYSLYRYIPKMDENKIKKDYDDSFEAGYARRYYFTE